MSTRTSQLILTLVDRVTAPARRAAQSIRGITGAIQDGNRMRLGAVADVQRAKIRDLGRSLVGAGIGAAAFTAALRSPIQAAMAFESAMADVRKVVDFETPAQFTEMGRALRAMSREIPISAEGLAAMAAAAGQAGLQRGQILEFVRSAAMVGTAFDISADQAGDALAHLRTGLNLTTPQVVSLADAMNELSNRQASTAADILDVVTRVGAQAKQFGLTGEQVAALGSAMLSTGQAPEVVATSLRNMGQALTRGTAATKRQQTAFALLGLGATATAKSMQVNAVGTIEDVVARLNQVPAHMRAAVSSDLFGDEARALGPLITNQKLLSDSLAIVAERANYTNSALREYNVRSQTSANKTQLFSNSLRDLQITIGTTLMPVMDKLMAIITPVIDGITRFAAAHPRLVQATVIATGALIGFRLASLAVRLATTQTRLALIDGGLAFGGFATKALRAASALGRNLVLSLVGATLNTQMFLASLKTGGIRGMVTSLLGMLNPIKLVSFAFRGLLAATGIGLLVLAASMIMQHWSGIMSFFRGFGKGFAAAIAPVRPALEPLIQGVKTVVGWVKALIGDKGEDWSDWGVKAGSAVGGFVSGAIGFVSKLVDWFKKAVAVAMDLAKLTPAGLAIRAGAAVAGAVAGGRKPAGRRRHGGPVIGGQEYLVGEAGAEIFKAPTSGRIHTAGQRPSGEGGGSGGGRNGVFAPRIQIVGGNASANEIAEQVMARLRDEYQRFSAGSHSDHGEFAY